jgi:hypothetical protein
MKCCEYNSKDHIHKTSFSSKLMNESISYSGKLDYAGKFANDKHSSFLSPFGCYKGNKVL